MLRQVFEVYGPVEDVVTFPGRMYAFVNFKEPDDAARAADALQVSVDARTFWPLACSGHLLAVLRLQRR